MSDDESEESIVRAPVHPCEIYVCGEITTSGAQDFVEALRRAEAQRVDLVLIRIHSKGGDVYAAMRMVDAIQAAPMPVHTCVEGCAMSAATLLFSCGERRFVSPHATLMVHSIRSSLDGDVRLHDLEVDMRETRRLQDCMFDIMRRQCGFTHAFVQRLQSLSTDLYMDAREAVACKLATSVGACKIGVRSELSHASPRDATGRKKRRRK